MGRWLCGGAVEVLPEDKCEGIRGRLKDILVYFARVGWLLWFATLAGRLVLYPFRQPLVWERALALLPKPTGTQAVQVSCIMQVIYSNEGKHKRLMVENEKNSESDLGQLN